LPELLLLSFELWLLPPELALEQHRLLKRYRMSQLTMRLNLSGSYSISPSPLIVVEIGHVQPRAKTQVIDSHANHVLVLVET
jgi:hypothetical protein